jgi:homoaconitase/3-isopropylmalate dehydratase large subunit
VKTIWQGRAMQVAAKYGDHAPMATVCCNACRTCTTTNLLTLAAGVGLGAVYAVAGFGKRLVGR